MSTPTTSAPVISSSLKKDSNINSLIEGDQWAGAIISYSFVVSGTSRYSNSYPDKTFFGAVQDFSSTQQTAAINALNSWFNVASITFNKIVESSDLVGDIRFAFSSSYPWENRVAGKTYFPSSDPSGGDVWLNPAASELSTNGSYAGTFGNSAFSVGSYGYYALIHELGHALGLKHPFEPSATNSTTLASNKDSRILTVMSYTVDPSNPNAVSYSINPQTPMVYDIAAIQAMYGANKNFKADDTPYLFDDKHYYFQTIWDGGGTNSIIYVGNFASTINLNEGHGSQISNPVYTLDQNGNQISQAYNVWIAYGTNITSAFVTGTGNCTLIANNLGNTLTGGSGNDTLTGGTGSDFLLGSDGTDTVVCSGNYGDYKFWYWPQKSTPIVLVDQQNGRDGTDYLGSIESLRFANQQTFTITESKTASWGAAYTGSLVVDSPIKVTPTVTDATGSTSSGVTIQWQRSSDGIKWTDILGATGSTYSLTNSDLGQYIGWMFGYINNLGYSSSQWHITSKVAAAPAPDTTSPTIASFSPYNSASGFGVSDNIELTFDEAIKPGNGYIHLQMLSGKVIESFNTAYSTGTICSGNTLAINPTKDLNYGTKYFLSIDGHAITDISGNSFSGLSGYSFTTTDTLSTSSVIYTLATKEPNKLAFTGTVDFSGVGNKNANVITGGNGNDTLAGGLGNDTLSGGAGNNTFVFDTKLNATSNLDQISDFVSEGDSINLSKKIFTAYKWATVSVDLNNDFVSGVSPTAQDTSDHFLYDTTTGALYYDADGSGAKTAVQFAVLAGAPTLTASDLHIY